MTKARFTWKDAITILAFILMATGWLTTRGTLIAKQALLEDQVDRNRIELETYDLSLIDYKLQEMNKKLDRITVLLEN